MSQQDMDRLVEIFLGVCFSNRPCKALQCFNSNANRTCLGYTGNGICILYAMRKTLVFLELIERSYNR